MNCILVLLLSVECTSCLSCSALIVDNMYLPHFRPCTNPVHQALLAGRYTEKWRSLLDAPIHYLSHCLCLYIKEFNYGPSMRCNCLTSVCAIADKWSNFYGGREGSGRRAEGKSDAANQKTDVANQRPKWPWQTTYYPNLYE